MKTIILLALLGLAVAIPVPHDFEGFVDEECEEDMTNAEPAYFQPNAMYNIESENNFESEDDYTEITNENVGENDKCEDDEDMTNGDDDDSEIQLPAFPDHDDIVLPIEEEEPYDEDTTCEYPETTDSRGNPDPNDIVVTTRTPEVEPETNPYDGSGSPCENEEEGDEAEDARADNSSPQVNLDNISAYAERAMFEEDMKIYDSEGDMESMDDENCQEY